MSDMKVDRDEHPIRNLPAVEERVESGVVRFGDDWPGVFIRGDSVFYYAHCIDVVAKALESGEQMRPGYATLMMEPLKALRQEFLASRMGVSDLVGRGKDEQAQAIDR